jgi:hypothetical protein
VMIAVTATSFMTILLLGFGPFCNIVQEIA